MSSGKLAWASLVIGLFGGIGAASAAPCSMAGLAAYQSMGATACSVGALNFSGFSVEAFPGTTAQQIAPGDILVTPIANGFALSSARSISASAGELLGLRLLFGVSAPSLTGATVALGMPNSVSGDGVITALLGAGSAGNPIAAGNAIAIAIDGFSDTPVSFASSPFSSYAAFLELGIDGGTFGSASLGPTLASVTFAQAQVQAIPEPGTIALSMLAMAALLASRRRSTAAA